MKPVYPKIAIDANEIAELTSWINLQVNTKHFSDAKMGGNRKTTRYNKSGSINFPAASYVVRDRVAKALGFDFECCPDFADGMVASWSGKGDTCYYHKDPVWHKNTITTHCNVLLQAPNKGGSLYVEGQRYAMQVGQPICYPVSELTHGTSKIEGDNPRLMWVFGFCITPEKAKELFT